MPVVALLYSRLREHAFTSCLRYGKRTTCAALNVRNPHPCQAVFTHRGAWSPQSPLNSRRAIIGGGCPLSCPAVYAKLGFQERLSPTVACINTAICYSFATFFAPAKVLVEIPSAGLMRGSNINSTPKAVELKELCPLASALRIQDQTMRVNSVDPKSRLQHLVTHIPQGAREVI